MSPNVLRRWTTAIVVDAIRKTSKWFWDDPDRHREGRLQLDAARREVVRLALIELGVEDDTLAACIGDAYSHRRDIGMAPLPDAIDTVRWLRDSGLRLALLTNGAGVAQRKKIDRASSSRICSTRFSSKGSWDSESRTSACINGRSARWALSPAETWMVGDNLEWDVAAPQKLGMSGVWIDARGRGVPEHSTVDPGLHRRAPSWTSAP